MHDLIGWGRIVEITVEPPLVECTIHERHDGSIIMFARNAISRLIVGWKLRQKQTVSRDTIRQYRRKRVRTKGESVVALNPHIEGWNSYREDQSLRPRIPTSKIVICAYRNMRRDSWEPQKDHAQRGKERQHRALDDGESCESQ